MASCGVPWQGRPPPPAGWAYAEDGGFVRLREPGDADLYCTPRRPSDESEGRRAIKGFGRYSFNAG